MRSEAGKCPRARRLRESRAADGGREGRKEGGTTDDDDEGDGEKIGGYALRKGGRNAELELPRQRHLGSRFVRIFNFGYSTGQIINFIINNFRF